MLLPNTFLCFFGSYLFSYKTNFLDNLLFFKIISNLRLFFNQIIETKYLSYGYFLYISNKLFVMLNT